MNLEYIMPSEKKKKPDTKKGQMYDSTYMKYLKKTKSQREKEE